MRIQKTRLALGLGITLAACGGSSSSSSTTPATTGGTSGGTGAQANVIRTSGTGQAVSQSANQRFDEAARMMRDHDNANEGRGDWERGVCNDIADRFEAAANAQPGGAFAEAWFNRGLVFERCGRTDDATTAMRRAIQVSAHGNFCRARVQLGVYQYRQHQVADAQGSFEAAVHDDPNCVEGYTNLAMIQRERGGAADRQQAVANIRQALARDDRYIPALNQLALTYLAEAGDDPHSQRLLLAGIVCSQAAQVTSQRGDDMAADVKGFLADIFNTWGLIDIKSGQIIHALDHFRRAFTLNPNMFEAYVNYGTINLSFRGYQDARDAFQHAVQLRDGDYDSHIGLGVALRGLRQVPEALAQYERARTIDANRPDVYYNLGVLHEGYMGGEIADLQHAIEFLENFVGKAGAAPRYADAVTRAQQHIRNDRQAIQALQAAAALNAAAPAGGSGGGAAPAPAAGGGGGAAPAPAPAGGDAGAPAQ